MVEGVDLGRQYDPIREWIKYGSGFIMSKALVIVYTTYPSFTFFLNGTPCCSKSAQAAFTSSTRKAMCPNPFF